MDAQSATLAPSSPEEQERQGNPIIEVTIVLNPKGRAKKEADKTLLGVICIANDGTGTAKIGNYKFALSHSGKFINKKRSYKRGKVKGFKRSSSVYRLLYRVLKKAGEV